MRAGELLGRVGHDGAGRRGRVVELRAHRDGSGALVVVGLVVGTRRRRLLGYQHAAMTGPALLGALLSWLHRATRYAPWEVVELTPDAVRLRCRWEELAPPPRPG